MPKSDPRTRFGVSMGKSLLDGFDALSHSKDSVHRSEAIRDMVRNLLSESKLKEENAEGAGTLTLDYNHHQRELEEKLTGYQHHHRHAVVSAVPVHPTQHLCLEVFLLRGRAKEIKRVADGPIATKGVQHGKLVLTTVGRDGH